MKALIAGKHLSFSIPGGCARTVAEVTTYVTILSLSENYIFNGSRKFHLAFMIPFRRHKVCGYQSPEEFTAMMSPECYLPFIFFTSFIVELKHLSNFF